MGRRPWVKLWADILDSRQLASAGEAADWLFTRLLVICGDSGVDDTIPDGSAEAIAWRLRKKPADIEKRLTALDRHRLIEWDGETIRVLGWAERQSEKTDAERMREYRSRTRSERVTNASRDMSRTCHVLDAEEEQDAEHISQPPAVREGPPPEPPPPIRTQPPPKTDEDLKPLFAAWCRGSGQKLTWGHEYVLATERIAAKSRDPAQVEKAAKHYVASLTDGFSVSLSAFAGRFDHWRAESERKPTQRSEARKRDDPRHGAPSIAAQMPAEYACRICRGMHVRGVVCPVKLEAQQEAQT